MSKTPRLVGASGMGPLPSISEVGQLRSTCNQLRREVEGLKKQFLGAQQELEATSNQLRQSELARASTDEYARKLEQRLDKTGKGVQLLKVARIQSDLEFLEKENAVLFQDLKAKESEMQQAQAELHRQHGLVDQAARNAGLPSRATLEELYDLRQQMALMTESLGDRDEQIRCQAADLQDFHVYKADYKRVKDECDALSVQLRSVEDDKGTLLDYVEDLRRGRERDAVKITELTGGRDDLRGEVASLDVRRAELEALLKEQLQILHVHKTQIEVLEVQVEKHKRSDGLHARGEASASEAVAQLAQQARVVEVELGGMLDQMRGVLDLTKAEQVDLNARVDSLTHRMTSALAISPKRVAGALPHRTAADGAHPGGVVVVLSRVSRQLEALVEQHMLLKAEARRGGDAARSVSELRACTQTLEQHNARMAAEISDLHSALRDNSAAWTVLHGALGPAHSAALQHVPGREAEVARRAAAELGAARQAVELLESRLMDAAREREQTVRVVSGLRDTLEDARAALAGAPPAEELQLLRERCARLEAANDGLAARVGRAEAEVVDAKTEVERMGQRVAVLQREAIDAERTEGRLREALDAARQLQEEQATAASVQARRAQEFEDEVLTLKTRLALRPQPPPPAHPPPPPHQPYVDLSPPAHHGHHSLSHPHTPYGASARRTVDLLETAGRAAAMLDAAAAAGARTAGAWAAGASGYGSPRMWQPRVDVGGGGDGGVLGFGSPRGWQPRDVGGGDGVGGGFGLVAATPGARVPWSTLPLYYDGSEGLAGGPRHGGGAGGGAGAGALRNGPSKGILALAAGRGTAAAVASSVAQAGTSYRPAHPHTGHHTHCVAGIAASHAQQRQSPRARAVAVADMSPSSSDDDGQSARRGARRGGSGSLAAPAAAAHVRVPDTVERLRAVQGMRWGGAAGGTDGARGTIAGRHASPPPTARRGAGAATSPPRSAGASPSAPPRRSGSPLSRTSPGGGGLGAPVVTGHSKDAASRAAKAMAGRLEQLSKSYSKLRHVG
ncbi:hypothetical protein FOA52_005568 [Chlamydomonas sp. UWO 241]|nr:hypothetical protein FOA52_005568 [Chlamydomonas sp. UWO 241]